MERFRANPSPPPSKGAGGGPPAAAPALPAAARSLTCTAALALLLLLLGLLDAAWPLQQQQPADAPLPPLHARGAVAAGELLRLRRAGAPPPFALPRLTPRNTAYQMVLVGPPKRQLLAAITLLQLRATDAERDIVVQVKEPLAAPLMEVLEQLNVTVRQQPFPVMQAMEHDFGQSCSIFWACWQKLLTWNETQYAAVLNLDTDFLALQSLARVFDLMAAGARSPYDVGGVADPIVAATHKDSSLADVLNGGMFLALPSRAAYERVVHHAQASEWQWGEMLWLNTFAARYGAWVRLPLTYNFFPVLIRPGSPYLAYAPVNWRSIHGLHFAGVSKAWADTSLEDCRSRGERDCAECCVKWVEASGRLSALLAANAALAAAAGGGGGGEPAPAPAAATAALGALLPAGWQQRAAAIVQRNAQRGYTFDKLAWHDGYTGGTWAAREEREALEAAAKGKGGGGGGSAPAAAPAAAAPKAEPAPAAPAPAPAKAEAPAPSSSTEGPGASFNESSILAGVLANKCIVHSGLDSNGDESVFTLCGYQHVKQRIPQKGLS